MRILVTGATGLVGSALLEALASSHECLITSRREGTHPHAKVVVWDTRSPLPKLPKVDAVVNLAGERIIGKRWTRKQKAEIARSRIETTGHLVDWIETQTKPPVLVSASAVGYYGAWPKGACHESRPPGTDFAAKLCHDWEATANQAAGRRVIFRFGHIMGNGGYLGPLVPLAKWHLAGPLGGGKQPMPWVHVDDVVGAIRWAIEGKVSGTFNLASPGAAGCTQKDFAKALGRALGKPFQLPVPGFAIGLRFGFDVATVVLGGQELDVSAIQQAGYAFKHHDLDETLTGLVS